MAGRGNSEELQQRVCRACQQTYDYPVPKSSATRFYCENCAELPALVRSTFEKYNRRIKELSTEVQQLRRELERRASAGQAE